MKKIISLFLALVMIFLITVLPASAASATVGNGGVRKFGDFYGLSGHIVYYPAELETQNDKWPVIVWANGTDCIPALYADLLEGLAKNGYVVVASSETMSADGTDQCNSIDYIFRLNGDSESQFYQKIDSSRVAAVGHSQGGRSSVNAAQQDSRIKCVVSIAGSNVKGEADGLKTPTFFITGTADLIVMSSLWVKPAYKAVAGPAVYASLKDAVHTTCMTAPQKVLGYTTKWLDAILNSNDAALEAFKPDGELAQDTGWKYYASKNLDFQEVDGTFGVEEQPSIIDYYAVMIQKLFSDIISFLTAVFNAVLKRV